MNKSLHSSAKHNWQTPQNILDLVRIVGPIELDPCGGGGSLVDARETYLLPLQDGLVLPWGKGLVFCNPPYGTALKHWIKKACGEARGGSEIILLVPSRTDTKWFREAWAWCSMACLWSGRIRFVGARDPAPFPSILFYYGTNNTFYNAFKDHGIIYIRP